MPLEVHVVHLFCLCVVVFVDSCVGVRLGSFLYCPGFDIFSSCVNMCVACSVDTAHFARSR